MPYLLLWYGVHREGAKLSPGLASGLFCYVPLHKFGMVSILFRHFRSGDILIVWRLDRLGRSLKHLIETVTKLQQQNIAFQSITENINTLTATGQLVFHIFGTLAEFERNLIRGRTIAGLEAARARGRLEAERN